MHRETVSDRLFVRHCAHDMIRHGGACPWLSAIGQDLRTNRLSPSFAGKLRSRRRNRGSHGVIALRLGVRWGGPAGAGEAGGGLFDAQPRAAGPDFVEAVAVLGIEPRVAALGAKGLAVDEESQHGRRRLEDMAGRDDQVGPLAGLDRADLVGDSQDLGRRERDGLEGQRPRASRKRPRWPPRREGCARPFRWWRPPDCEWIAKVTPAACSFAGLA